MTVPRLIEVALPIREISAESVRDKSLRHGHISTLHLWWARRPLAASRAVVFASLVPDPDDPQCPPAFRAAVLRLLKDQISSTLKMLKPPKRSADWINDPDPYRPYDGIEDTPRNRLLTFIARWSNEWIAFEKGARDKQPPPAEMLDDRCLVKWETSDPESKQGREVLRIARELVRLANGGSVPTLLDPFSGGGAIPLEAARLGCQAIANDYNPVAYLILRATCEFPQKYGKPGRRKTVVQEFGKKVEQEIEVPNVLAHDVECWAKWILERARGQIGHLYPTGKDDMPVVGYLWARTAPCSNPTCRAEIPLLRSLLICNKPGKRVALTMEPHPRPSASPSPLAERGPGGEVHWRTSPDLWEKLKPLAREMRHNPTEAEELLWQHLRNRQLHGFKFRRQHSIERFIADFYCAEAQLVVEVDGPIHHYTHEDDAIRQEFLEAQGLRVLRFTNEQVMASLNIVMEQIAGALQPHPRSSTTPSPLGEENQPHPRPSVSPSPLAERGPGGEVRFGIAKDKAITRTEGTMIKGGDCRCPVCQQTTPVEDLRCAGLEGKMGERMVAVITDTPQGKDYRPVEPTDLKASKEAARLAETVERPGEYIVPEINAPNASPDAGAHRSISVDIYGFKTFGSLFNLRQLLAMQTFIACLRDALAELEQQEFDAEYRKAVAAYLGLWVSKLSMKSSSFGLYHVTGEKIEVPFGRQAIAMVWDYPEAMPFSETTGGALGQLDWILRVISRESLSSDAPIYTAYVLYGDGARLSLAEDTANVVVTDPPYFDSIAYADLSDFFYVWLKRGLGDIFPEAFATPQTPKTEEAVAHKHRHHGNRGRGKKHFQQKLAACFSEANRSCRPDGILVVMFAHQSTEAWTALINALFEAGLNITATYPIDTELTTALKRNVSALESSITVICRPRQTGAAASFRDVRQEIERVVAESVHRFWNYGFRGADLIVACYGPSVGVFGRYERVERGDGTPVDVPELLGLARESALKAIAGEFTGDTVSRLYFVWANLYGTSEQSWDDARLVVQMGGDTESAMEVARRRGLFVVDGATCRLALLRDRTSLLQHMRSPSPHAEVRPHPRSSTSPSPQAERGPGGEVLIDQMLTIHSSYRDRMERRAFWLNTALIASSLFLTVFAFVGDDLLRSLGLDPATTRFLLGLVAVVVLICSITEFRVDWRSVAGRHAEAVSRIATLKANYRKSFIKTGGNDPKKNARLTSEYYEMMSTLPPIPDRWFNDLKAEHQFKRQLSERISQCPKAPTWFLRLQLRIEGIREALRLGKERR